MDRATMIEAMARAIYEADWRDAAFVIADIDMPAWVGLNEDAKGPARHKAEAALVAFMAQLQSAILTEGAK